MDNAIPTRFAANNLQPEPVKETKEEQVKQATKELNDLEEEIGIEEALTTLWRSLMNAG